MSFNSNTISDQLKRNLKGAGALVALITTDSLRSPWIPFEIGSFWPTEKTIVLILGPGLTPEKLPGPLKGWLSICIENSQAFEQLNQVVNQLEKKLGIRQNVNRSRRDRYLKEFITRFKAWESRFSEVDVSQQKQVEELSKKLKESNKELEAQEQSLTSQIRQLEQQLDQERSQKEQLEESERLYKQQLEKLEAASQQEKEDKERSYQNQKQKLEQNLQSLQSKIKLLEQQLSQERSHKQQLEAQEQSLTYQIKQLKQQLDQERSKGQAQHFTEDLANGIALDMIAISGGKFMMGSPEDEGDDDEKPQHEVTLQPFFMGKYPITQAQYQKVMGKNLSQFKGDNRPVEEVSWDEAIEFCQRLSKQTGTEYRLPSEAEWEYACRAGTTTKYYFGDDITSDLANYGGNVGETTSVGKYSPNAFGLYDMHGNVWEWCQDDWHKNYKGAPNNGNAWLSGISIKKVIRGGSWWYNPSYCRSAYRDNYSRDYRPYWIGFRVVCVAPRTT